MSKKVIVALGAALVAAAVSVFVYANNGKNSMDDIFNANVEALANVETGDGTTCYNRITTAEAQKVLYCGTCTYIEGKPTVFPGKGTCK